MIQDVDADVGHGDYDRQRDEGAGQHLVAGFHDDRRPRREADVVARLDAAPDGDVGAADLDVDYVDAGQGISEQIDEAPVLLDDGRCRDVAGDGLDGRVLLNDDIRGRLEIEQAAREGSLRGRGRSWRRRALSRRRVDRRCRRHQVEERIVVVRLKGDGRGDDRAAHFDVIAQDRQVDGGDIDIAQPDAFLFLSERQVSQDDRIAAPVRSQRVQRTAAVLQGTCVCVICKRTRGLSGSEGQGFQFYRRLVRQRIVQGIEACQRDLHNVGMFGGRAGFLRIIGFCRRCQQLHITEIILRRLRDNTGKRAPDITRDLLLFAQIPDHRQ